MLICHRHKCKTARQTEKTIQGLHFKVHSGLLLEVQRKGSMVLPSYERQILVVYTLQPCLGQPSQQIGSLTCTAQLTVFKVAPWPASECILFKYFQMIEDLAFKKKYLGLLNSCAGPQIQAAGFGIPFAVYPTPHIPLVLVRGDRSCMQSNSLSAQALSLVQLSLVRGLPVAVYVSAQQCVRTVRPTAGSALRLD
jgi:hypothetical protein